MKRWRSKHLFNHNLRRALLPYALLWCVLTLIHDLWLIMALVVRGSQNGGMRWYIEHNLFQVAKAYGVDSNLCCLRPCRIGILHTKLRGIGFGRMLILGFCKSARITSQSGEKKTHAHAPKTIQTNGKALVWREFLKLNCFPKVDIFQVSFSISMHFSSFCSILACKLWHIHVVISSSSLSWRYIQCHKFESDLVKQIGKDRKITKNI